MSPPPGWTRISHGEVLRSLETLQAAGDDGDRFLAPHG